MIDILLEWLFSNKIELLGAILGLIYIYFSIRQNILTWPTGLLTSAFYVVVFLRSGFYADMGLQVYYVVISIYGWYFWLKGKRNVNVTENQLPVRTTSIKIWINLSGIFIIIFVAILYILLKFTDSTVPYLDTLTTALSIVATWMLAKKYIEHWLIWIFVDVLSIGLYIYKSLWPTVILFTVYTAMAFIGYVEWKKDLKQQN